jgi:hypothetical protein
MYVRIYIYIYTIIYMYTCISIWTVKRAYVILDIYCTMLRLLDHFWSPVGPCFALRTPFRLVIRFIYNPNHLTKSLTIIHYAVSHLHSLQSYTFVTTITYDTLTRLHWPISQLSVTFSDYHRLYIFTLRNSRRELTPRIHLLRPFLRLLFNNSLVELLLNHWLN